MKELINQIRSLIAFCGYEIESTIPQKLYIVFNLKSKSLFRKKGYQLVLSTSLNGILTAERELSRNSKNKIIIFDPINNLLQPTFGNVLLFHDLDQLQEFLNK